MRVPVMSHRVVWIELDSALELMLSRSPIPIVVVQNVSHRSMRLSQGVVQLESSCCGRLRLLHCNTWSQDFWTSEHRQVSEIVSKSRVGECKIRVFLNCLGEVLSCFIQSLGCSHVPVIATEKVCLIGIRIDWMRC